MRKRTGDSNGASCSFLCRGIHSMAMRSPKLPKEILLFDEDLALQLEDLEPKEQGAKVLNFAWISHALDVALQKHVEAVGLIPSTEFPLIVQDDKWMNEYMDQTARMLDVCNALTGALSNTEQGHLLIRHACLVLIGMDNASPEDGVQASDASVVVPETALERALKSLQEWVGLQALIEQKSPKYSHLLKGLIDDLRPPRDRDRGKGKGFLHALYGANVVAVFAFYVSSLAVLREGELLSMTLPIYPAASWSASLSLLVQVAKEEAREKSSFSVCIEDMKNLHTTVEDLISLIERSCELNKGSVLPEGERTALFGAANDLRSQMDKIGKGLQLLCSTLNDMLKAIVSCRTVLLDKLGNLGADTK